MCPGLKTLADGRSHPGHHWGRGVSVSAAVAGFREACSLLYTSRHPCLAGLELLELMVEPVWLHRLESGPPTLHCR